MQDWWVGNGFEKQSEGERFFSLLILLNYGSLVIGVSLSVLLYFQQTFPGPVTDPAELPKWNYDGSSTGQAPGDDSEVIL